MTTALFLVAAGCALGDWFAVARRFFRLEYLLKPLTLAVLIAAAASSDLGSIKVWVLAALAFGLLGDIALMRASAEVDGPFLAGLGAFLAGHVCWLAAFVRYGVIGWWLIGGGALVVLIAAATLPRVLRAADATGGRDLAAVVGAYSLVLGAMAAVAVGTARVLTGVGGVLFLVSDAVLAHDRFVRRIRGAPLAVMITYHLAQFGLVLGLVRR